MEDHFHAACAALDTSELNGLLLTVIARVGIPVSTDVGAKTKKFALGTVTGPTKNVGEEKHVAPLDTSGDEDYPGDTDPKAIGIKDGTIVI